MFPGLVGAKARVTLVSSAYLFPATGDAGKQPSGVQAIPRRV